MQQASQRGALDTSRFGDLQDARYDYPGGRLATASADGIVRVWSAERQELLATLRGPAEAIVSLSWGEGRWAATLAGACASGAVFVWREVRHGEWQVAHQCAVCGPVSVVAFCPPEYGLVLAIGGGGGEVTLLTRREVTASPVLPAGEQWQRKTFKAHEGDIATLSWAPSTSPATLAAGPAAARAALHGPRRMATAGTDRRIRAWGYDEKADSWSMHQELSDGRDSGTVRDIAWRPNTGIPTSVVACCTEEGCVSMWVQDMEGQAWRPQTSWKVEGAARRLAWSKAGTVLGVSVGEAGSLLYKEGPLGQWSLAIDFDA